MKLPALIDALPYRIRTRTDWQGLARYCTAVGGPRAEFCREFLEVADATLKLAFREGEDIVSLIHGRAGIVDFVLQHAWSGLGLDGNGLALVAVGGYGRGELHPGSDVDLVILTGTTPDAETESGLSSFLTLLWDLGLLIGHSVRSVEECVAQAAADVTVATNLMETRLLSGNPDLLESVREQTAPDHIWPSREFFEAKLEERRRRYARYGESAYKLEPNVKEGPGGLRDIQMVGWLAKRHLGASSLHELVRHGFLTEGEFGALMEGQAYLWRVRFALHDLAGRAEDRILFDFQIAIAELFGFRDQDHNLAVEQFMQQYYRTVMELERLNEMLLQHYQEAILHPERDALVVPVNQRFQIYKGFLEVSGENVFRRYPSALLELFLVLQQHPEVQGVRASTIRLLREHRHLIDDDFRNDLANRSLFMEILRQPAGITHEFRRMNRYGILAAYWPSFALIVGRMQYDLFHIYTVDEHTLVVLRNLRRMALKRYADELPFCHHLFAQVPKPEILYLAALFHDIAKGRGGDHSELGAVEAEAFCLHHGLSAFDARKVAWLVRNHLLISVTAQRKDISDPSVVNTFARAAGNTTRLTYLYLLTVADIRATNPELWNSWKDSLLTELYQAALRAIRRGLHNPLHNREVIDEASSVAAGLLNREGIERSAYEALWSNFSRDYFLRHSGRDIAWQTAAILRHGDSRDPLVLTRELTERGSTEIFIFAPDHNHLFAHTTCALTSLGLNILDARIITAEHGYTMDTFQVLDEDAEPVKSRRRIEEITESISTALRTPDTEPEETPRRTPRRLQHFRFNPRISFGQNDAPLSTRLELISVDHPGLLCKVGKAFMESGVLVLDARIATLGAQAEDIFLVTDLTRKPITSASHQERIRHALLRQMGHPPENPVAKGIPDYIRV
ncbi:MAG: [protein-PII] uridylyltransferase [Pseudomonadota bacterium]|nr:[protein-PII] uridylyltransferase [Pseudomonadota bacterium]